MQKYYKITGLDEGVPITPFAVCCNLDSDELDYYLDESGDRSRYYEEISKSEYERLNLGKEDSKQ